MSIVWWTDTHILLYLHKRLLFTTGKGWTQDESWKHYAMSLQWHTSWSTWFYSYEIFKNDKIVVTKELSVYQGLEVWRLTQRTWGNFGDDENVLYPDGGGGYTTECIKTHQIILLTLVHFLYV